MLHIAARPRGLSDSAARSTRCLQDGALGELPRALARHQQLAERLAASRALVDLLAALAAAHEALLAVDPLIEVGALTAATVELELAEARVVDLGLPPAVQSPVDASNSSAVPRTPQLVTSTLLDSLRGACRARRARICSRTLESLARYVWVEGSELRIVTGGTVPLQQSPAVAGTQPMNAAARRDDLTALLHLARRIGVLPAFVARLCDPLRERLFAPLCSGRVDMGEEESATDAALFAVHVTGGGGDGVIAGATADAGDGSAGAAIARDVSAAAIAERAIAGALLAGRFLARHLHDSGGHTLQMIGGELWFGRVAAGADATDTASVPGSEFGGAVASQPSGSGEAAAADATVSSAASAARDAHARALEAAVEGTPLLEGAGLAHSLISLVLAAAPADVRLLKGHVRGLLMRAAALEEEYVVLGLLRSPGAAGGALRLLTRRAEALWAFRERCRLLEIARVACTSDYGASVAAVPGGGIASAATTAAARARDAALNGDVTAAALVGEALSPAATATAAGLPTRHLLLPRSAAVSTAAASVAAAAAEAVATATLAGEADAPAAAIALLAAARDCLDVFRALVPPRVTVVAPPAGSGADLSAEHAAAPMLLHNDALFLAEEAVALSLRARRAMPAALGMDPAAACLADALPALRELGARALLGCLAVHRRALVDDLEPPAAPPFDAGGEDDADGSDGSVALERAGAAQARRLGALAAAWRGVLPPAIAAAALGHLADALLQRTVVRVLAMPMISADASADIARLLRVQAAATEAALGGPAAAASAVRHWSRAAALASVLDAPLVTIADGVARGVWSGALAKNELASLVRAIFQPSPQRSALLRSLASASGATSASRPTSALHAASVV